MSVWKSAGSFFQLTKPSIGFLVLITAAATVVKEGSLLSDPVRFMLLLIGIYAVSGCANGLNEYFERDTDAVMARTRQRRPLPQALITPGQAFWFAIGIGVAGLTIFAVFFNGLSALLSLGTILFYSFFYTLILKPRTSLNIVIGGAAGAMGPIISWAAITGALALTPWLLFLIIFFWTPAHFWALAICLKDDYAKAGYPMLPNVKGDAETYRQIWFYTIVMVITSFLLVFDQAGIVYTIGAGVLGSLFLHKAWRARQVHSVNESWRLFRFSILYLFALFFIFMIDNLLVFPHNP